MGYGLVRYNRSGAYYRAVRQNRKKAPFRNIQVTETYSQAAITDTGVAKGGNSANPVC